MCIRDSDKSGKDKGAAGDKGFNRGSSDTGGKEIQPVGKDKTLGAGLDKSGSSKGDIDKSGKDKGAALSLIHI